jgi:putative tryptophan/tyrosine transport system substrate-binding protein
VRRFPPIAFLAVDFDPLAKGYVANLSHPGGNVTGIFVRQLELAAKRVEIAARHSRARASSESLSTRFRANKAMLRPRRLEVKGEQGYEGALGTMDDARGQPIILPAGPMFLRDRAVIAEALLERRIPSVAAFRENMEAGALISYGFDLMGLFYDIATYVQRLAGGAKPFDMPIEQSPRFLAVQSEDGGFARRFFIGCVHRSSQRGARMNSSRCSAVQPRPAPNGRAHPLL